MGKSVLNLRTREVHNGECDYVAKIEKNNRRDYGRLLVWIAYRWFGFDGCKYCNPQKHIK